MSISNITLIGMPGSGKSYIGNHVAQALSYDLIELDSLMEARYHLPLQTILDTLGEDTFLIEQEEDSIRHTSGRERVVISPGGSIVYTENAMGHLSSISHVAYLETPLKTIIDRIQNIPRGIVGLKDKTLQELFEERSRLYLKW